MEILLEFLEFFIFKILFTNHSRLVGCKTWFYLKLNQAILKAGKKISLKEFFWFAARKPLKEANTYFQGARVWRCRSSVLK